MFDYPFTIYPLERGVMSAIRAMMAEPSPLKSLNVFGYGHRQHYSPSYTKKGPGRMHRHGTGKRGHGLTRNLFDPGSVQMRAAEENAVERAELYLNAAARRRSALLKASGGEA